MSVLSITEIARRDEAESTCCGTANDDFPEMIGESIDAYPLTVLDLYVIDLKLAWDVCRMETTAHASV